MKCPFCNAADTKVINSRPANGGESIRRRRACETCRARFTTFETLEKSLQTVVKRDGSRVPFSRERLLRGIEKACKKRPVTEQQIDGIIAYVEKEAFRGTTRETTTEQIGLLVLKSLLGIDKVAYLRFASVYKQFNDLADFRDEISKLVKD
ncbi:transcriptional repressor NrdR [bacterium]|nr:transcriptional repressor NrdR [bacterium]